MTLERGADGAEPTLTAYLDLGDRTLTPEEVHQLVVDGFRGRRFVMAPHRYVIRDGSEGPGRG